MNKSSKIFYTGNAAAAFTKQSSVFDEIYSGNAIIQYKRKRVRDHVEQYIKPGSLMLEINCGTGDDAIYFAEKGHQVHATDISTGMLEKLSQKIKTKNLENKISYECCSFLELQKLKEKTRYDYVFSNFAGLNCTNDLQKVLLSFSNLLKEDGVVTLVLLPGFCLWETLLVLKGKFKTAFRRFFSKKGRKAHIEGEYFRCWYYSPSFVKKIMKKNFDLVNMEGVCCLVPPSYIENFAEKHPAAFHFLKNKEEKWKSKWPWRSVGDYYIISFKKRVLS